jgi:hypothetical protein
MIELDGQTYPAEVRQSQPVALETQETPAGSSDFPGLSEEMSLGRTVLEGASVQTGEVAPDLDTFRASAALGSGLRVPAAFAPQTNIANEGEAYDGELADPGGSGAPLPRSTDNAPKLLDENLAWQPGEEAAARKLLAEMLAVDASAKVARFVRYPDDKRIMLVFNAAEESQSVQMQY